MYALHSKHEAAVFLIFNEMENIELLLKTYYQELVW